MSTVYFSKDDRRRDVIASRADLNGFDFLEVLDAPTQPDDQRQRTLFVHFINDPTGLALTAANVRIEGGERIRNVGVIQAGIAVDPRSGDTVRPVLVVEVDRAGDFSTYTLRLVVDPTAPNALNGLDPVLRDIDFSFKVNCRSDFDCSPRCDCPEVARKEPAIDYLARDFNSLRQLMLDRLSSIAPRQRDRNLADLGVTLIELMAYVGDQLSYRQDAVATEAYLGTARRRVSVRRHARLVDYFMHDGCNARVWLHVRVDPTVALPVNLPAKTQVLTAVKGQPSTLPPSSSAYTAAIGSGAEVFETLHDATLHATHNELRFYTWGGLQSCLPKGAVRATLRGSFPQLQAGGFLLLREVRSPRSGEIADSDVSHRQVVRLVEVTERVDPIGGAFENPPVNTPLTVTDIRWAAEDALPFALCISSELDDEFGGGFVGDVSLAYGNLVLADHGQTLPEERLDRVRRPTVVRLAAVENLLGQGEVDAEGGCDGSARRQLAFAPVRYRPRLRESPLTQAVPLPEGGVAALPSAAAALQYDAGDAIPAIQLTSVRTAGELPRPWTIRLDLLNSGAEARHFVVELESDGEARLRFGDGGRGAPVTPGEQFSAVYRIGNGTRGNVGADSLVHLVTSDSRIERVANPMPARGGRDPESIEEARQRAPFAFRENQLRAVTPDDYALQAARYAGVQRAVGSLRWTGSWHTMFVSVDRFGGGTLHPEFERNLRGFLEPLRMAGLDLEIDPPRSVALEVTFRVQVRPGYFRDHVATALLERFNRQRTPDGQPGLFHPDRFTFGQTLYLSPWVAAAQSVEGVESVEVVTFQRRDAPGDAPRAAGFITVGRFEVPMLDNNPDFPERGTFEVLMEGGK
jgi:hypothetical protein